MADLVMCWTLSMAGGLDLDRLVQETRKVGGSGCQARWFEGWGCLLSDDDAALPLFSLLYPEAL